METLSGVLDLSTFFDSIRTLVGNYPVLLVVVSFVVACIFVAILAVIFFRALTQLYGLRQDFNTLLDAISRIAQRRPPNGRLKFYTSQGERLFQKLLLAMSKREHIERQASAAIEACKLTATVAQESHNCASTAKELAELVYRETSPETLCVAAVLKDSTTGAFALEHIVGLPRDRLEYPILSLVDEVFDSGTAESISWGYHSPTLQGVYDFAHFGIGTILVHPLRNGQGICGALWLALSSDSASLSLLRRSLLEGIAGHAVASFDAARISEQRAKATEQDKDLILGVSHDLRAPGSSALYAVKSLLNGELGGLTPEQHVHLRIVEHSIEDQLGLLSDVLDFAKHKKGALKPTPSVHRLRELLAPLVERERLVADEKNLTLVVDDVPDVMVKVDSRQFSRVVTNLLSNALKYTDVGSVRLSFSKKDSILEILVVDTGIGVPDEDSASLFTEFERCRNSSRKHGFGLGLPVSRMLAELNGGYVIYRDNPDGGSIFSFGVPLEEKVVNLQLHKRSSARTVLIVDDDSATLRTYSRYLKPFVRTVLLAETAVQAETLFREHSPEAIITDINLTDGTTVNFIEQLPPDLPLLVISGSATLPDIARRIAGNDLPPTVRMLEKPIDRHTLVRELKAILQSAAEPSASEVNNSPAVREVLK